MKRKIFAVEDEESIRELYVCALANYDVETFETGAEFFARLAACTPDLFLVDLMLPDTDGGKIVEKLRADPRYADIPVMIVSAKGDELSKVRHLNLGADDYLAKPFGIMELCARINAHLRKADKNFLRLADVVMDDARREVRVGDAAAELTLKEYELLKYFLRQPQTVLRREDILNDVWGIEFDCESRTLDMHVKQLRHKLAGSRIEIETVRGVGYLVRVNA